MRTNWIANKNVIQNKTVHWTVLSRMETRDRLCGLVVRVLFSDLPDFLKSSESGMGSTQPREYNLGAT
jgi:hypothetical protein